MLRACAPTHIPPMRSIAGGSASGKLPRPTRAPPDARRPRRRSFGRNAKLLIVFCSDAYDLDELLAGIGEHAGGAPLIGCSTAGEIATGGPRDASVVVTALGGDGLRSPDRRRRGRVDAPA